MKKIIAVQFARKRSSRTDYRKRLKLLQSGKPRLVVRRTSSQLLAQIVEFSEKGDQTKILVTGSQLKKMGWKFSAKNLSGSYLTGMLLGKKALAAGVKEAVVDAGTSKPEPRGRFYALVKGARDAGLKVPVSDEVLPADERTSGSHLSAEAQKAFADVKNKIQGGQS